MLALQKSSSHHGVCTPNVLPCRINHNGPVNASTRYWNPVETPDGKQTSYFRGRKLNGHVEKVPEGYRGVILSSTEKVLDKTSTAGNQSSADQASEEDEEVGIMEDTANFDEVVVWGHERVPGADGREDPYMLGLGEWVELATKIHGYEGQIGVQSEKEKS